MPRGAATVRSRGAKIPALRQLVVALTKALQAHRKADAFLGRLEDDEGRGLAVAQFVDQIVVHDHFGDAAVGQAAYEAGAADIVVVDLEPEPRGDQDAERRHDAHQPALLIAGLEHDHDQAEIGAVLRGHALHQRALLVLGAGRRLATDLPVAMDRADRALGGGLPRQWQRGGQQDGSAGERGGREPLPPRDIEYRHSRVSLYEPPPLGVRIIKPGRWASLRTW